MVAAPIEHQADVVHEPDVSRNADLMTRVFPEVFELDGPDSPVGVADDENHHEDGVVLSSLCVVHCSEWH